MAVNLSFRGLALLVTLVLSVMGLGVLSGRVPSDLSRFPFWDSAGPCVVLLEEGSPLQVTP